MSTDLHTLSGAYAVDALSPDEAEQFATHLEGCPACRDEVRELQETAARMGAAEAIAPPPALKARVLAAADRTPQLPPKVARPGRALGRRPWGWVAAAAAAVVLLAGTVIGIRAMHNDSESPVASNPVSQVFAASDAKTKSMRTPQGTLTVAASPHSGQMAVATDRLRPLPHAKVYQMWAIHNGRVMSVGVVEHPETGKVMPIPAAGTTVAMTVEPAGGSRRPTSKPFVEMDPAKV
jgi:anti-sigma-K factor RskA